MIPTVKHHLAVQEYEAAAIRYNGERVPLESAAYVMCILDSMNIKYIPQTSSWSDEGSTQQPAKLIAHE